MPLHPVFFVLTITLYPPKLHEVISQIEAMIGSLFCLLTDSAIKGLWCVDPWSVRPMLDESPIGFEKGSRLSGRSAKSRI